MFNWLYEIPAVYLLIGVCIITTTIVLLSSFLTRRHMKVKEVGITDGLTAAIAVIYAVFIGFVFFIEINNFNQANNQVDNEAQRIFALYNTSSLLPAALANSAHHIIDNYLNDVIKTEWPGMQINSKQINKSMQLNILLNLLKDEHTKKAMDLSVLESLIQQVSDLNIIHSQRIDMAKNLELGRNIWIAVLIVTLIFLISNTLFSFRSSKVYYALLTFLGLIVGSIMFVLIFTDRPFIGEFSVSVQAFAETQQLILEQSSMQSQTN